MGVYEVLPMTPKIRQMILDEADTYAIKSTAVEEGMLTLRADAVQKWLSGITSFEEILRETAEG